VVSRVNNISIKTMLKLELFVCLRVSLAIKILYKTKIIKIKVSNKLPIIDGNKLNIDRITKGIMVIDIPI